MLCCGELMRLSELKQRYVQGENISQLLSKGGANTETSIEVAYELQAGSYSEAVLKNIEFFDLYTKELADVIVNHAELDTGYWILDAGTGEMTSLAGILRFLPENINVKSFDISLSRILAAKQFVKNTVNVQQRIDGLVAEMSSIPFADGCFDLVMTVHALEPNRGREDVLIRELLRVCGKKAIFFEPSYEDNTEEGKSRMDSLGYVRDIEKHIKNNGGELVDKIKINNVSNALNPTYAFVVKMLDEKKSNVGVNYKCPISNSILKQYGGYFWSEDGMYAYPIIEGVPILKRKSGIILANRY